MSPFSWLMPQSSDVQHGSTNTSHHEGDHRDTKLTKSEASSSDEVSFDGVADHFVNLTEEIKHLREKVSKGESEVKRLQQEHADNLRTVKELLAAERQTTAALQLTIAGSQSKVKELVKHGSMVPFVQHLELERKKQRKAVAEAQGSHRQDAKAKKALEKQVSERAHRITQLEDEKQELKDQNQELKFDLECLKCTAKQQMADMTAVSNTKPDPTMAIPDVPFVLVLIDGDAYSFVKKKSTADDENAPHPATKIVRNIKNYLHAYIVEHGLPTHSKLIVKVLQNVAGAKDHRQLGRVRREGRGDLTVTQDFLVQFNESSPLFYYVDAGTGKERVDSKIHELYHIFIPIPSCHKIFVATATDNGFARMFEQLIDHPVARAKTCLISSGLVAQEIQKLRLETVEWPAVFNMRVATSSGKRDKHRQLKNEERERKDLEHVQKEKDDLVRTLGLDGYHRVLRDRAIAQGTIDLNGNKHARLVAQELIDSDTRSTGIRTRKQSSSSKFVQAVISEGEDVVSRWTASSYIEEGVD